MRVMESPGIDFGPAVAPQWVADRQAPPSSEDRLWMEEALALARSRLGLTWPNPTVGAVIVQGGQVVGRGFHPQAGAEHAEIMALREAGPAARGATLYVTLEPCAHYGRTPPCTEAVLEAGIARVVAATPDPNPLVRGRGLRRLAEAGVEITVGIGAEEAIRLNEPFFSYAVRGRPWVVWKTALSLDGKIATVTGDSRWITGPAARREVHNLRACLPAIMVGVGTVLADNPRLTARDAAGAPLPRQPLRVVVDTEARTPPTAQLLAEPGETLVACGEGCPPERVSALEASGAQVILLPRGPDGRVDLSALMQALAARHVVGVLLEGGPTLAASMLAANLVDEGVFHFAPLLIGGDGLNALQGTGARTLREAWRLQEWEWQPLGSDMQARATLRSFGERCRDYFLGT